MAHKLLLADDSVTIQRVIELTFADEDINVSVVADGRQAIDRLRSERPDIVLADVGMPERDGYEVASFVKNDPQLAHIPVILLTGAFEPLDEDRARRVGCDGVLVKPFEPQVVINRVRELLSRRRPVTTVPTSAPAPAPAAPQPSVTASPARSSDFDDLEAAFAPPLAPATEPTKIGDPLEDYFDRLDAAFATLPGPPARSRPAEPAEDLSRGLNELRQPPPERPPAADSLAGWDPAVAGELGPARAPHLSSAFAALLAAEQGGAVPDAAALAPGPIPEDVIEEIVQRVIARMTDDAVRRTVLDTAERLVREEIDRIKREARTGGTGQQSGR